MTAPANELRGRLPSKALDLLDGQDGGYTAWDTVCSVAIHLMNTGFTRDEFIAVVSESDLAVPFCSERDSSGSRVRHGRLESRLVKVWDRAEEVWNPPLGSAEDVRAKLEALSVRLDAHKWSARGSTDRAVAIAMVTWAHEIGVWTLDASNRDISVRAGVAKTTVANALGRLESLKVIRRSEVVRDRKQAQRWVIQLGWGLRDKAGPHEPCPPIGESCGLVMSLSHPAFLGSALGQTAERVWLCLTDRPDSTADEIADRTGVTVKTVRRTLDRKLIPNQLAEQSSSRANGKGRPSATYRASPEGRLDQIAANYGVSDWYDRTSERYGRERDGFRAVLHSRDQQSINQSQDSNSP